MYSAHGMYTSLPRQILNRAHTLAESHFFCLEHETYNMVKRKGGSQVAYTQQHRARANETSITGTEVSFEPRTHAGSSPCCRQAPNSASEIRR